MTLLINRTQKKYLESLESFFYHLGNKNYYEERNWYNSILELPRETHLNYLSVSRALTKIAEITGLHSDEVAEMTIHSFAKYFYNVPTNRWDESGRNQYLSASRPAKICPICYQENSAYLLPWLLRLVTTCIYHGILIINTCPFCNNRLQINDGSCGRCGAPIKSMEPEGYTSKEELFLSKAVWSAIGCTELSLGEVLTEAGFLFPLDSPSFFSYLWKMGKLLLEYDRGNPYFKALEDTTPSDRSKRTQMKEMSVQLLHNTLMAAFVLLISWPNNYHLSLRRIAKAEEKYREENINGAKKHSFPYRLNKEFVDEKWSWLLVEMVVHTTNFEEEVPVFRNWLPYLTTLVQRKETSKKQRENLSDEQSTKPIAATSGLLEDVFSLKEAAAELSITSSSLRKLVEAGFIHPVSKTPNRRVKWLFSNGEITRLSESIYAFAEDKAFDDNAGSFFVTCLKSLAPLGVNLPEFLTAICERKIEAYRDPHGKGLASLWFRKDELSQWKQGWLYPDGLILLSVYKVMNLFSCSKTTLQKWGKSGILVPINYQDEEINHWMYDDKVVAKFNADYITSEKVAEIIGYSTRTVLAWTDSGRLVAVSGPKIDGVHEFRFHKENIIRWRYERMTSGEVKEYLGIKQRTLESWLSKKKIVPIENMGIHPYWFYRDDIEQLKAARRINWL